MTILNKQLAEQFKRRRKKVIKLAQNETDLDAMLVTDPIGVRYLTGFSDSGAAVLFDGAKASLITSLMFKDRAPAECPGTDIVITDKSLPSAVSELKKDNGYKKIGLQKELTNLKAYEALASSISKKHIALSSAVVMECRAVKDEEEIRLTQKAVTIAEKAFRALMNEGARFFIGKTEKQLSAELSYRMQYLGADRQSFPNGIIVGSGPNSAGAHHVPTDRKVRKNEPVLFDFGALVDGYCSDVTRVVFTGKKIDPRLRDIYHLVREAHSLAIRAIKPRRKASAIDKVARDHIMQGGYKEEFRHGLGHAIGMEVHEAVRFTQTDHTLLKKHMVMTVEPGVYIKGFAGVRLEDDVLVTADGCRSLNKLSCHLEKFILT
jgi:Xaa-Pro aminopeptidase